MEEIQLDKKKVSKNAIFDKCFRKRMVDQENKQQIHFQKKTRK